MRQVSSAATFMAAACTALFAAASASAAGDTGWSVDGVSAPIAFAADGGAVVVRRDARFASSVERLAADGRVVWREALPRSFDHVVATTTQRACVAATVDGGNTLWLRCWAADSGAPERDDNLVAAYTIDSTYTAPVAVVPFDDGRTMLVVRDRSFGAARQRTTFRRVLLDASGVMAVREIASCEGNATVVTDASGRIAISLDRFERIRPDLVADVVFDDAGARGPRRLDASVARPLVDPVFLPGGGFALLGERALLVFDGHERLRWQYAIATPHYYSYDDDVHMAATFDALWVYEERGGQATSAVLTALDLSDGRPLAELRDGYTGHGPAALAGSTDGDAVVLSRRRRTDVEVAAIRREGGALVRVGAAAVDCSATWHCAPLAARAFEGGRVLAQAVAVDGGVVTALDLGGRDDAAIVPVRQDALSGLWFNRDTPGQGFGFEYVAASGTVAGQWLHFAADGARGAEIDDAYFLETDVDALRWLSLQSAPGQRADARFERLQVFRNSGGRFAQGPATAARAIGAATLALTSCDTAELRYDVLDTELDARGEAARRRLVGVVPLVRLTSRTFDCRDASGELLAPGSAPADTVTHGFTAGQSGAWLDPAASGQGFVFHVRPPAQDGYGRVTGAWFTYDPVPDDPYAQHWLSLQGEVFAHPIQDGTVELPILRTVGGLFDALPARATTRVGTATLRFDGCERASFAYRFDSDAAAALGFAGRSGEIALHKLGGCSGAGGATR